MNAMTFHASVAAHPDLAWLGVKGDSVYVQATRPGGPTCEVPIGSILAREWADLEPVLTGARGPRVLIHQTRIVGYFSQVHNWNRSKRAELRDRTTPHRLEGDMTADGIPDDVVMALVAGGAEAVCDAKRPQ